MATLNEVYSSMSVRRRYEVWFLRLGLADGSGAWWFRYLLMNPGQGPTTATCQTQGGEGRRGCGGNPQGMPVQLWATWFPAGGRPQSFIQGFPLQELDISQRGKAPFHFRTGENAIEEDSCRGALEVDGHAISWNLRYRSTFHVTLSDRGWIGFSRTPHSDAIFSGQITLDRQVFAGELLGFGVQGHNCGYRHRNFWTWTHAYFSRPGQSATTLEALVYEMPLGLIFRKAVLWHDGQEYVFRKLRESGGGRESMQWDFQCVARNGLRMEATIDGRGPSTHRISYMRTDGKGSFEVRNNSLASARLIVASPDGPAEKLETATGAVLEMVG